MPEGESGWAGGGPNGRLPELRAHQAVNGIHGMVGQKQETTATRKKKIIKRHLHHQHSIHTHTNKHRARAKKRAIHSDGTSRLKVAVMHKSRINPSLSFRRCEGKYK